MPDFESIYGKDPATMDEGEYKIAVFGYLHALNESMEGINKRLDETNGKVRCIPQHQMYFKLIGVITAGIIFPILVFLLTKALC